MVPLAESWGIFVAECWRVSVCGGGGWRGGGAGRRDI